MDRILKLIGIRAKYDLLVEHLTHFPGEERIPIKKNESKSGSLRDSITGYNPDRVKLWLMNADRIIEGKEIK